MPILNYAEESQPVALHTINFKTNSRTQQFRLLYGNIRFVTDGTPGRRELILTLFDQNNAVLNKIAMDNNHRSNTTIDYVLKQGVLREAVEGNDVVELSIPQDFIIMPDWYLQLDDQANVSSGDVVSIALVFDTQPLAAGSQGWR